MSTDTPAPADRTFSDSILVEASPEALYDLISDVPRTGEWSPICTGCSWDDAAHAGEVGAWFTGRNEVPGRTWETRCQVVAAERGREFGWLVGDGFVSWTFSMAPAQDAPGSSRLTESWEFLPAGLAYFHHTYTDRAETEIEVRTEAAHVGIPATLRRLKAIAEGA